jgi:L-glyceraldehyde 3-phosphate reductase
MSYVAAEDRYDEKMPYRRSGRSGLKLPAVSLGLWQNFGDDTPVTTQRAILRRAFDLGVTHFDLANNYGGYGLADTYRPGSDSSPYGAAEVNFGRLMREDFRPYRDELVISSKAGYDMWPGPYGEWGSRKYLLASLDQSLKRMGLEYVDIFYSHRFDPDTPLEETMGALDTAVRSGRALYAGISSYSAERTREAHEILTSMGTPLLIHQPSYSLINRWIEGGLLDTLGELGAGCIAFSPLALASNPKLLVLISPTAGVDVRSKATLLSVVDEMRARGTAVLIVSDELDDLRVCDRVLANFRGEIVREFDAGWADIELVLAMEGVSGTDDENERDDRE